MDFHKFNPWNWFKHEEPHAQAGGQIPIKRTANALDMPTAHQELFSPVQQLHQQIDRLFDHAFRSFGLPSVFSSVEPSGGLGLTTFRPDLNVSSDDANYQISLEAPGMTEADLSIEVKGDVLTIQGQKQEEQESKDRHFYRVERRYGHFQRTLALPDDAIVEEIQARMNDGVLNLLIPRSQTEDRSVKKITINQ
ncbi:MAG: Hsp20/alpha crystallin family protein [Pseudomonadales bacterium]|nr:Hsp20/alpha crystallin family protein [Pseudomonadales bacterium]